MVKFGRHLSVFRENRDNAGTSLFVVSYNDLKHIADKQTTQSQSSSSFDENRTGSSLFETCWRQQLEKACQDFDRILSDLWGHVFDTIADHPEARGALPSVALVTYADVAGRDATQELLVELKQIHEAATLNSEALRKLVKKYDKHHQSGGTDIPTTSDQQLLSPTLMPLVYTANFTIGRSMLQDGINLLRKLLLTDGFATDSGSDDSSDSGSVASKEDTNQHEQMVRGRQYELEWLQRLAQSMEPEELGCLVLHRGFHSILDHSHKRPIENSLTAYETAWTSGFCQCECDIAITKDEKIVLAHDDDFSRLALDQTSPNSSKRICDLTFKELMAMPLKSISRPPLLIDVLQSALAIGPEMAQLIIEIKPGNEAAVASALERLLQEHEELLPCVSVIMSFDAYIMHNLRQGLTRRTTPAGALQPKLLLLTVADEPKIACELQVSVDDSSPIDSWLKASDGSLDGVYLQYEKKMLAPTGAEVLRHLSERYTVGVWTYSGPDPDDYETFSSLVNNGNISFFNTDLPSDFRKGIMSRGQLSQLHD